MSDAAVQGHEAAQKRDANDLIKVSPVGSICRPGENSVTECVQLCDRRKAVGILSTKDGRVIGSIR